jgi:radical SAM protein with 4Fe4S-binding SPASM domain
MTFIVDTLIMFALATYEWMLTVLYPFVYSKTGRDNPRTSHIHDTYYMLRNAWITKGNIDNWLSGDRDLFPEVLQVQTINRCNAACSMCPYPYTIHLQPRVIMEDKLYTKIVEECASEKIFKALVPMSKNEPLLDVKLEDRIFEFKKHAKPHQVVELVTNGSALTPARFEKLVYSGVDLLTISLSAHTETTYGLLMQGLSWTQVKRNIEAVLASPLLSKINIFLRFILQQGNEDEYPAFRRYWKGRGLNVVGFEISNRSGSLKSYEILNLPKKYFFKRLRKVMGRRYYRGLCPHAFSIMHVLENGDVPLCANDWENRDLQGNVKNSTLREIYNSPRMNEIRQLMMQGHYEDIPACKDCSFWKEWL